jgi:hypothetical protein
MAARLFPPYLWTAFSSLASARSMFRWHFALPSACKRGTATNNGSALSVAAANSVFPNLA